MMRADGIAAAHAPFFLAQGALMQSARILPILLLAGCGASMAGGMQKPASTAPATPYAGVPTAADSSRGSYDAHTSVPAPSPRGGDIAIDQPAPDDRPGLGTTWGESIWSPVTTRPFERSTPSPWAVALIHYNDEDGVRAHAAHVGGTIAPLETFVGG